MKLRSTRTGGAALLALLLATAGCQREDAPANGGGMFGGANQAATANAAAPRAARGNTTPSAMANPAAPAATAPATAQAPAAAAGDGRNRQVRITNQSGVTITLIKGSPTSISNWGQDRIPSGVLNAGATVTVDFNDNNGECVYDLQATLMNGTERVRRGVNVCTVMEWIVTPDGSETR